jgi:amino-acid N-acetyltransferase
MKVEKAKVADVPQMHRLINHFANKGELLPRPISELYENIRDFFVVRDGGEVVACGALHILWSDLAEIKALSVAEGQQEQGLGAAIVQACLEEARNIGTPSVFCLTYKVSFFERFGFRHIDVMELPRKVWGECQRCPKFPNCDETAMILHL